MTDSKDAEWPPAIPDLPLPDAGAEALAPPLEDILPPDRRASVVIGGVGGSGTRMVAQLLIDAGYYLGGDLNRANDNLWAAFLLNHRVMLGAPDAELDALYRLFVARMTGRIPPEDSPAADFVRRLGAAPHFQHGEEWMRGRAESFLAPGAPEQGALARSPLWGWKCPPVHVLISRLLRLDPGMRYVHVVRHGLDMAFSSNQNQLAYWGPLLLGRPVEKRSPEDSLAYWAKAEAGIDAVAADYPDRVRLIAFEEFCADPAAASRALLEFCGADAGDEVLAEFSAKIEPVSAGRWRGRDLSGFDPADLEYLRGRGYAI